VPTQLTIMALKECDFCKKNKVPEHGQCSSCGFIDGLRRQPNNAEFKKAREINKEHKYEQYTNIDMLLMQAEEEMK
jgi:ribosomal protein L32